MMLRDNLNGIAKGQITGVREEGIRVRDFVARRYSPTVKPTRFGDVGTCRESPARRSGK